jgi:hypothetical protein
MAAAEALCVALTPSRARDRGRLAETGGRSLTSCSPSWCAIPARVAIAAARRWQEQAGGSGDDRRPIPSSTSTTPISNSAAN